MAHKHYRPPLRPPLLPLSLSPHEQIAMVSRSQEGCHGSLQRAAPVWRRSSRRRPLPTPPSPSLSQLLALLATARFLLFLIPSPWTLFLGVVTHGQLVSASHRSFSLTPSHSLSHGAGIRLFWFWGFRWVREMGDREGSGWEGDGMNRENEPPLFVLFYFRFSHFAIANSSICLMLNQNKW